MRTLAPVLATTLLLATPIIGRLSAQKNPEPQGMPTFTSRADLVLVPVQVRRHGEHVPGLSKDSFTVQQDGREQKVTVFEEVRTTTERLKRARLPKGEFSNELLGNAETARYTVIAIDKINTTTMDMIRLREGLFKFLGQAVDNGEPIRLVAINPTSIQILQDFTTDPRALAAALKGSKTPAGRETPGDPNFNEWIKEMDVAASIEADSGNQDVSDAILRALDTQKETEQRQIAFRDRLSRLSSLEALQQVALSLAGLPGRKSLVWASSGYPFASMATEFRDSRNPVTPSGVRYQGDSLLEASSLDEYTTHLLNTANIAVYPVDARGIINTAYQVMDPSRKYSPTSSEKESAQARNQDVITTFEHLAAATGGKPCFERPDLSGCFKDALEDSRDYYMVGYYIDRRKSQPGWHRINVKVAEKGVSVRSRNGFIQTKFTPEQTRSTDMQLGLGSRLLDPGIPFRGRWTETTAKGDKKVVGLELHIAGTAAIVSPQQPRLSLDIAAVARKPDGSVAGEFAQHLEKQLQAEAIATIQDTGITYKNRLEVPPGMYVVRLVIRDDVSGRMGSLSTLLKVD